MLIPDLRNEMNGANFGDERLNRRLPQIMVVGGSWISGDLEEPVGAGDSYRFTNNPNVDHRVGPHPDEAWSRAAGEDRVQVLHDSSFCWYADET